MLHNPSCTVLLLALLLSGSFVYGQAPSEAKPKKPRTPEDYKPRTLKEVALTADAERRGNKEETMIVYADILPSRVRVTYLGTKRLLPDLKKEVLRQWARLYAGAMESYTQAYEMEMLFLQDGTQHWLTIRKGLLPRLEQALKKGEAVDLSLIRLGAVKTPDGWELLLLVENFQKPD